MKASYITSEFEITDSYNKILLATKTAAIKIAPSGDTTTKLVVYEKKRRPHEFFIQDGTLTVKPKKAKWYNFLRIGIDKSQIKLFIPLENPDEISVKTNVGGVDISKIKCSGDIDVKVNTGKVNLDSVSCKSFTSLGNTGSVFLNNLTASKSVSIKRNTGKVSLQDVFAPEIFVKTNTGRVSGKLPSNTVITAHTNTGKTELPKIPLGEVVGGRCEIKTNTGSIVFE